MKHHDWNSMTESDFDLILENNIPELPPDHVVQEVTPWKRSINRILVGITMNTITLDFWGLNYILPAIGTILSLLGFRTLRRENRWFRGCWIITILRTVYFLLSLILNATIFRSSLHTPSISNALMFITLVLLFSLIFFFGKGFRAVRQKADLPAHANGATAMLIWYATLCLFSLLQYHGFLIGLIMILSYLFVVYRFFRLSGDLDEAGYMIQTSPVQVSDRTIVTSVIALLTIGLTCAYLFFNSYSMDWHPAESSNDAEVAQIKKHLTALGFPEAVLKDLMDEDIKACESALCIVVNEEDFPVNEGYKTEKQIGNFTQEYTQYDVKELHITSIGVKLPGECEQWKIFHHFLWTIDPGFYGTESILIWPAYRQSEGWESASDFTGHVLYDMNGKTYAAPYHSLGSGTYTSKNLFGEEPASMDVFATFSMPKRGENHRGYLSYTTKETQDGWMLHSWINYTHQKSWIQYPVMTAIEKQTENAWNSPNGTFHTIQDALSFLPDK